MQIISSSITRYHGGGCETGGFKDADPIRSGVHGKDKPGLESHVRGANTNEVKKRKIKEIVGR
jgi:hypothetical protein